MLDLGLGQLSALLFPSLLVAAILYSSVGHGGASGYMAVMVLFGLSPDVMRPVALSMNLAVTAWVLWRHRSFYADILQFTPLVLAAIPASFMGGAWHIEAKSYYFLVGMILLLSSLRMCWPVKQQVNQLPPHMMLQLVAGFCLGLLAGLTGVGGGVFLSPFLVVMGWCSVQKSIAPVAAFIFCNSISGLSGFVFSGGAIPSITLQLVLLAFIGALVGSEVSMRPQNKRVLAYLLGLVLMIAAVKMFMLGLS